VVIYSRNARRVRLANRSAPDAARPAQKGSMKVLRAAKAAAAACRAGFFLRPQRRQARYAQDEKHAAAVRINTTLCCRPSFIR